MTDSVWDSDDERWKLWEAPNAPVYPEVVISIVEHKGDAWRIFCACVKEIWEAGYDGNEFLESVMSRDYDNLLTACMKWVTIR
jgi:hypothetical protein